MASLTSKTRIFAAAAAVCFAAAPAAAQNAPQDALDMPKAEQDKCHVRPNGEGAPSEPLTDRLQDCNSVLKPNGLGDPDIVTAPPTVDDPMAIKPAPPVAPESP